MTLFVDVPQLCQLIEKVGLAEFLTGLTAKMRKDFTRWESFEESARSASHSDVGVIELMPITDADRYAFKYVNGHPRNPGLGLSKVMAFGVLANVHTGYPLLLAEMTLTTALRTAAASAMAAQALARADSRVMGIIGCGAQSEFQAIAFHTLLNIEEIRVFDIDSAAMKKLDCNLRAFPHLTVTVADSAVGAVRGADIVTTCTADEAWATILTPDMVTAGMHINAVGGDRPGKTELHVDVLRNAKIFVEFEPKTRVEGDIQQLSGSHPVHDLWRVIANAIPGRDTASQVTVFDSVGFALEDYSALTYLYDEALESNFGEYINLIPEPKDLKNLFELINGSSR